LDFARVSYTITTTRRALLRQARGKVDVSLVSWKGRVFFLEKRINATYRQLHGKKGGGGRIPTFTSPIRWRCRLVESSIRKLLSQRFLKRSDVKKRNCCPLIEGREGGRETLCTTRASPPSILHGEGKKKEHFHSIEEVGEAMFPGASCI